MRICFENSIGSVVFGDTGDFKIIEIDGLAFQPKIRNMTGFTGFEGEYCLGERMGARAITIKGDIQNNPKIIKNAVRVLMEDGVLKIRRGSAERCINAVCTGFEMSDKGNMYKAFIIQFSADCPYFEDVCENEVNLFSRTKLIKTSFVLPTMFTRRESKADIFNTGDTKCEPVFEILSRSDNESGNVILDNLTTDTRLVVEHTMKQNERVMVDIKNRTVISDSNGEILGAISEDSFLSDFLLEKGRNTILVTNESGGEITVRCRFKNRYAECVVR